MVTSGGKGGRCYLVGPPVALRYWWYIDDVLFIKQHGWYTCPVLLLLLKLYLCVWCISQLIFKKMCEHTKHTKPPKVMQKSILKPILSGDKVQWVS